MLVSPNCVSACEGFSYALQNSGRATIVGNYPSAGAFGDVGRGQYNLPDDIKMQYPTGRPLSPSGELIIEGIGVIPDITGLYHFNHFRPGIGVQSFIGLNGFRFNFNDHTIPLYIRAILFSFRNFR